MNHTTGSAEARAIQKLIDEIDALDTVRDRVGRRVMGAFLATFAFALSLLAYVALFDQQGARALMHPGPRVGGKPQPAGR